MSNPYESRSIYAMATDPIYIGTGGYTIGRVDNTIVRDPITRIPKIPGSSLAGTWRYYVALELVSKLKPFFPAFKDVKDYDGDSLSEKLQKYNWKNLEDPNVKREFSNLKDWYKFFGNQVAKITCAGQDNVPNEDDPEAKDKDGKTGHCGHCIVCKAFGYSKKDYSWQGMLFFSDLHILFFPVFTRFGVKWITSERILSEAGLLSEGEIQENQGNTSTEGNNSESRENEGVDKVMVAMEKIEESEVNGYINLGWLNLPYKKVDENFKISLDDINKLENLNLFPDKIVIVPDSLISQIINSNLEVRTSVSIDPIRGAAKESALFTSEAIPRGTIFYGNIRLLNRREVNNDSSLPNAQLIWDALKDTKKYYETLGIGGMTTRGFGRMRIEFKDDNSNGNGGNNDSSGE